MISGINFIDLNQKDKTKQQKFNKLSNLQKAKVIKSHINYIGRIEGAENNGKHSIFGTLNGNEEVYKMDKSDILAYIDKKVSSGAYVFKVVISLKENWENLIRSNICTIAEEYNIKVINLDWVASFHTEDEHPHIHFFLDKNNYRKVRPYVQYNKIKEKLNYAVYKKIIQPLQDRKNSIRNEIKYIFNKNIDDIIGCDTNRLFNNKISEKDLNEVAKLMIKLYKIKDIEYKTTKKCSWKMQYQIPEVKGEIRNITNKIIQSSEQIKSEIDQYMYTCIEIEKIKNSNNMDKQFKRHKLKEQNEFILKKIDNQILSYLKETKILIEQEKNIANIKKVNTMTKYLMYYMKRLMNYL